MRVYRLVAAGLTLATVAACGGPAMPTLIAGDVARQWPAADTPTGDVSRSVTALGYRLTGSAFPAGQNSVVSPLSIAYAFAMARAGAGGETAAQMDRVLGFPATGLHEAFNLITRQIVTADVPPPRRTGPREPGPPVVCVGAGLFPQRGMPIGRPFLTTLAAQYGAGVYPVDFAGGTADDTINQWVRRQTAGRIKQAFDALPPSTALVLANTIYLRADWAGLTFAEDPVTTQPFTRAGGDTVGVPMMHGAIQMRYAVGDGWQAVEVPFAGGTLAMRILLPAPGRAPGPLLAPETMAKVASTLRTGYVGVSLPRWDFGADLDLVTALKAMGLTLPFAPAADFGGISPGLFIGQAVHRANITVDEWGTEAAAITGLAFATAAEPPPPIQVRVDHPFAFAVMHAGTGIPLFMGQVMDPSAR